MSNDTRPFNIEREIWAMKRRLARKLDADVRAAERRIAELTATEWREVEAGLREHPGAAEARRNYQAGLATGEAIRLVIESVKATFAGLAVGLFGGTE